MSNTNTEVLTTAYEKLQGAITQANTVLPELEEAVEKGNLDNYATTSDLEEKASKTDVTQLSIQKANQSDLNVTNSNVSKNATDIATQKDRIDSFTSLAEGSTTGDAELIDARTVNGNTYSNLGGAVRAISNGEALGDESVNLRNLGEDLNVIKNLLYIGKEFSITDFELGTVAGSSGSLLDSTTRVRTQKISAKSGDIISLDNYIAYAFNVTMYNGTNFVSQTEYKSSNYKMTGDYDIIITVKRVDEAEIESSISDIASKLKINKGTKLNDNIINNNNIINKAVQISHLSDEIISTETSKLTIGLVNGSINGQTGATTSTLTNRLRTENKINAKSFKSITLTSDIYNFKVYTYDTLNNFIEETSEYVNYYEFGDTSDLLINLSFKKVDDSDMTSDDATTIKNLLTIEKQFFNEVLIKAGSSSQFSCIKIAASDSSEDDKSIADIVCDGINDEVEINQAILKLKDTGGRIQLANGHYYIDSLTEYTGYETRKYGIYFPDSRAEIILEGFTHVHKYSNTSLELNDIGVVIEMTQSCYDSIATDDKVSLIGAHPSWIYSHKFAIFNNICLRLPNNKKNIVCLDMKYFSEASCDGIFVTTLGDLTDDTNVNPKCIGIRGLTGGNNGFNYYIKHCKVLGVGTAYHIAGEHLVMETCTAQRCGYGYILGDTDFLEIFKGVGTGVGIHNLTFINICFEYVWGGIYFGKNSNNVATFIDLNVEEGTGSSGAWATQFIVKEDEQSLWGGNINYFLISTDTWGTSTKNIWYYKDRDGEGRKFKTINDRALKAGTTAQRPTNVDFNFKYYDTTLGKNIYWIDTKWIDGTGTEV